MRFHRTCLWLMTMCVGFAISAAAQSQITSGVIQGVVSDQSHAVVVGADVTIKNLDTNLVKQLKTDQNGRFVALLLPPGKYQVIVARSGFSNVRMDNIDLTVGTTVNLEPTLGVAATGETVIVTGSPAVDPSKTESSSTLNEIAVSNTPILGRKFEDLLTLTPGVSVVQGPDGDEINFNGQRGIFNNISLDGGDYNNGFFGEQAGGQRAAVDITLEAVKEFQVVAAGSSAEFGRTAGGVVNVITKSGTNNMHGSLFHFQRLEALSANTSDGKPLKDFNREQFGGTVGGPIIKNKLFFFIAAEEIAANLQRANLSQPVGSTACPVTAPTIQLNEAQIKSNVECQRLALLNFYQTKFNDNEGLPVRRPTHNSAVLGKMDWNVTPANQLSVSYNFDLSRKVNETFDVATYGNSANGTEGTSTIHALNANLTTTITPHLLSEAHITYSREGRPRAAAKSPIAADTAMGFATTFRFGSPYFIQPGVDELFQRFQLRDNISLVKGNHTIKLGGEWLHSNNSQVFRGFFTGKYIFDSVAGFLRYSSPAAAGGYGPMTVGCSDGSYVTAPTPCAAGTTTGGPLLLYLQGAGVNGLATDATGASDINNEEPSFFVQDKWVVRPNLTLNYGLRWEAQYFPQPKAAPSTTAYGPFLNDPRFPSNGKLPNQTMEFQPRVGLAWDVNNNQKSVLRASFGIYNARQNMLTQVGSITTNGLQQQTIFSDTDLIRQGFAPAPTYPGVVTPAPLPPGTFPLFSGVRVFDKRYKNPRIYTTNVAFEQQLQNDFVFYTDVTWSKAVHLSDFLDYNRKDRGAPFAPALGETMVASSRANSLYRGATFGLRKRFSHKMQMDVNYTYSQDWDNDSNERDPFTDRSGPATPAVPFNLRQDFAPSDRDIRHKFNVVTYGELPWGFVGNLRIQAHSAQPLTLVKRNDSRKDNVYSSVDWRLSRPIKVYDRYAFIPGAEMFNTFNSKNNVNPLVTPGLFNFDGYLRQGVGDPRQLQLSLKFTF